MYMYVSDLLQRTKLLNVRGKLRKLNKTVRQCFLICGYMECALSYSVFDPHYYHKLLILCMLLNRDHQHTMELLE